MRSKAFYLFTILALVLGVAAVPLPDVGADNTSDGTKPVGALPMKGVHLVKPPYDLVVQNLMQEGSIPVGASQAQIESAVQAYYDAFAKHSVSWPNPQVAERAMAHESALSSGGVGVQQEPPVPNVSVQIMVLPVEFGAVDEPVTYEYMNESDECVQTTENFSGPMQGDMSPPGMRDNNTVWYSPEQTASSDFYGKLIFGYEGAGVIRTDLNGGQGVNLSGYTVQDYYDKVSGAPGRVTLQGSVLNWVTVNHAEAYYGANTCTGESGGGAFDAEGHRVPTPQLIADAVAVFNAAHPGFNWKQYDQTGDGVVDTFWIIHAGAGEESGGGAQGPFSIWSHSSDMRYYANWYPKGLQVAGMDTPDDPTDDVYIGPYTMQPENADLGVFAEEFGHNVFGLPDLYTTDVENSVGFWNIMAGGSWGGPLGGSIPVGMPLWFRMIAWCGDQFCNWQYPMAVRDYRDPAASLTIGQLEDTPEGTLKGIQINLPNIEEQIPNNAGDGGGAWSGAGRDMVDLTLDRDIPVPAEGSAILSFDSYWEIEEDWDYGYVMVSTDAGTNWTLLDDVGDYFTTTNPNGNNLGVGLTGSSGGKVNLQFDLSAYKGQTVKLRLYYKTDAAATWAGWWVDNLKLGDTLVDDFSTATEPGTFPGWTNSDPGWLVVPTNKSYTNYYLVEWRAPTKYDSSLRTAYVTTYSDEDEWQVERVPYNIPGALLYYRNQKYPEGYSQFGYYGDPPSFGPKNKLLVVDMNYGPMRLIDANGWTGRSLNNRTAAYDAALTLQPSDQITLSSVLGVTGGPFTFAPKAPITQFNDAQGYYAGLYYGAPCTPGYFCYTNRDGSVVIPARDLYSTRITDFAGNPFYDLYGASVSPSWLGSGNPADDNVQFGVNIKLTDKTGSGDRGTLRIYNYSVDAETTSRVVEIMPGMFDVTYTTTLTNNGVETAKGIRLTYDLDTQLQFVGFSEGEPAPAQPGVLGNYAVYNVAELAAGDSTAVTLHALYRGGATDFLSNVSVNDGQMSRGPVALEGTATPAQNWLFLPFVTK